MRRSGASNRARRPFAPTLYHILSQASIRPALQRRFFNQLARALVWVHRQRAAHAFQGQRGASHVAVVAAADRFDPAAAAAVSGARQVSSGGMSSRSTVAPCGARRRC
ncbi:MAG: hypothetical protein M5U01_23835 [Ardenticatenaceae bacterium]|nr:hypothetical protein [Ardenticatenaceae bacterium]